MASLIPAAITAAGSIFGGLLGSKKSKDKQTTTQQYKPTRLDNQKSNLIDQLLSSVNGQGPFNDLFNTDENAFQTSFVEPAKAMFNNQIAPQIQQQYIANGQQRGTGLEDTLTRAGVDLDSMLNSSYLDFQNQGKDRMSQMINQVLGAGGTPGGTTQTTTGGRKEGAGDIFSGYLQSPAFSQGVTDIFNPKGQTTAPYQQQQQRAGFKPSFQMPTFDVYAR